MSDGNDSFRVLHRLRKQLDVIHEELMAEISIKGDAEKIERLATAALRITTKERTLAAQLHYPG